MAVRLAKHKASAISIRLNSLHATLAELGAQDLGIFTGPSGSELKMYAINGNVVIVQMFADGDGYEVYAPIDRTNSVTATLTALRALAQ